MSEAVFRLRGRSSEDDVRFFDRLHFESFRQTMLRGEDVSEEEARSRFEEFDSQDPLDPWGEGHEVIFGEDEDGNLAGLIWVADRKPFWRFTERHVWIYNIHVIPEQRRRGLARLLLRRTEDWAKERRIGSIALHVVEWNEPARHLYESEDYILVATHNESCFYEKRLC